ncbi:MAG: FAD-binding oxidoreductase [Anaerolineae bacterium]|nr:FAD-binding oxidoreductase [Anaerolineae bacterium]
MDTVRELEVETQEACPEPLDGLVKGRVYAPGEPGYHEARRAWNLTIDQYPALVVVARDADDVAYAVRWAADAGLKVAVQATGHGVVTPADDAVLIVTSEMTGVEVDPATHTAWVEAGTKWGQVLAAAQAHGLAPLLGSSPDVGAVGYTLGGGLGWLSRKYGLSADSVRAFELVTADGRRIRASADEHPDLFWGLRGGGGSLGVVTRMQIALYPVTTVYGGNLLYPIEIARDVLMYYRDWLPTLPDEMTSSVVLMNFPPFPQVPEPVRGKSFAIVRGCYAGDIAEGQALVDAWRHWRAPAIDMFGPMSFADAATISSDPEDPVPGVSMGAWMADLADDTIDTLIRFTAPQGGPPPVVFTEVRHIGGAVARADAARSVYGNRSSELLLDAIGMAPTREAASAVEHAMVAFEASLAPHLTGGVYMNFLHGEASRSRIADAYPAKSLQWLRALKREWDPDNLFSHAFAVLPEP